MESWITLAVALIALSGTVFNILVSRPKLKAEAEKDKAEAVSNLIEKIVGLQEKLAAKDDTINRLVNEKREKDDVIRDLTRIADHLDAAKTSDTNQIVAKLIGDLKEVIKDNHDTVQELVRSTGQTGKK